MNPVLPEKCFVPDSEARVMPDGRLYVYGSWDTPGKDGFCSNEMHCFSTDDLENWTDHGIIFRNDDEFTGVPWHPGSELYAPDAIYKDGKYYLYVCGPGGGGYEGVAVADSPTGVFSAAEKIDIADGDGIDPAIFVDDDGQAYYFWGQIYLRGGKLKDDMKTLIPESINGAILTEREHGFHEGSSIRKRGDKYYMVYTDISRGTPTCMGYAMAENPLGPYKKCGVIIDNIYCDPCSWNNHGSIACFKDKWYVFYHRSSRGSERCRRLCIEEIQFDENGYIKEVDQTSVGVSKPMDAFSEIRAFRACRMMRNCYISVTDEGEEVITSCGKNHWGMLDFAEFKYIDFGTGCAKSGSVTVKGKGEITFKAESEYIIGSVKFDCKKFEKFDFDINEIKGVHTVWTEFGEGDFEVYGFSFR